MRGTRIDHPSQLLENTMTLKLLTSIALLSALAALTTGTAQAQTADPAISIKDAWVRTAVPGQRATGAFMKITAKEGMRLVGASTPVAGVAEVHEMKMDGDVMKMRAVPALELPAGKTVELKPGGFHVMLMDLKAALPKDNTVPLTLLFKDAKGVESRMELKLPVAAVGPGGSSAMDAHKH
jgi:periplasmic copper chaperone A